MFRDRDDAAHQLAARLSHLRGRRPLVLAIPRGAVPMGRIVADALGGELDVVLVRKLGAPGNPELAIGAVDEDGRVTRSRVAGMVGASDAYVRAEADRQLERIRARRALYGVPPADPSGRTVVVLDDGFATGATALAALESVRARGPSHLVAAGAAAPPETARALGEVADEVVCLVVTPSFFAVGQFFADFRTVTDADVLAALGGAATAG